MVVDLVGDVAVELADRVVRHLGEVHECVVALEILEGDVAGVLRQHLRALFVGVVQPAHAVEAGVEAGHVVAALEQVVAHAHADVPVSAGEENLHIGNCLSDDRGCRRQGCRGRRWPRPGSQGQIFQGAEPWSHSPCK